MTTALMYHGELAVSLPGWLHSGPIDFFYRVGARANEQSHDLLPLINAVRHFFDLAQTHAENEIEYLSPIENRIKRVLVVYPGNESAYESWEPFHESFIGYAMSSLSNPINMCTASIEFIWRCWEIALDHGGDPDNPETCDPDLVLARLSERSRTLGSADHLIAECALNRYCMPRSGAGTYATDSELAAALMATIASDDDVEHDDSGERLEALSFFFFDNVLQPYTKRLTRDYSPILAQLMSDHADTLETLRGKCQSQALELLSTPFDSKHSSRVILHSLQNMKEEAREIAEADSTAIDSYFNDLAQNPTIWASLAGILGSLASSSPIATASFSIATLSVLGSSAVKARQNRKSLIESSPWSFVYYAQRKD